MEKERWHRLQWVEAWGVQPWEVQMWDVQMWDVQAWEVQASTWGAQDFCRRPQLTGVRCSHTHTQAQPAPKQDFSGAPPLPDPAPARRVHCHRGFSHRRAVLQAEGCVSSPDGPRVPDAPSLPAWSGCLPSPHCSTSRDFICDTNHRNCWALSSGRTANPRQASRRSGPPPPFRHHHWPCVPAAAGDDQVGHEVGIIVTAICQFAIRDSMDLIFAKKDLLF